MTGPAAEVLVVGEMADPEPGPGEVRIRVEVSGVNPGDVKKRQGWQAGPLPYPRIVPHSDGAGTIDRVGTGISQARLGRRVWCYGAQSYRAFGTAAELTVVPDGQAVDLPEHVEATQGACLGIPGITGHRAVFAGGGVKGATILVTGGAGAVGRAAVVMARRGGATVIATVSSPDDVDSAAQAGAHFVVDLSSTDLVSEVMRLTAGEGVDRIVEVAFAANSEADVEVLKGGGVIAAYASDHPEPTIPFWPMLFKNVMIQLLGSDDFPLEAKREAASQLTLAAATGELCYPIAARFPLTEIADAQEAVERPRRKGRVVVDVTGRQPTEPDR